VTQRQCDFKPIKYYEASKFALIAAIKHDTSMEHLDCEMKLPLSSGLPYFISNGREVQDELFYLDYFRQVCVIEYTLYFDSPVWNHAILQPAYKEPSIRHAVLAISSLTLGNYEPKDDHFASLHTNFPSIIAYAMFHYSSAIRLLNARLDTSRQSAMLAILASILFFQIESLLGSKNVVQQAIHIQSGLAILQSIQQCLHCDVDHLRLALEHLQYELNLIGAG
jgi:hypothetical protein